MKSLARYARAIGAEGCVPFDAALLVPEERIRELCRADLCGNYGNHYMCPPHIGELDEIRRQLSGFRGGLILQLTRELDVRADRAGVNRAKLDLHRIVLDVEKHAREEGHPNAWGLIGGNCSFCDPCLARTGEPCPHPTDARPSLESLAVDVLALLARFGLDNEFHPDRITWTGCVLI